LDILATAHLPFGKQNHATMLINNLRAALRGLWRNKTTSLINLSGLVFGLAAAIAVLLYVQDERSYEACHERSGRILRALSTLEYNGQSIRIGGAPNILAPILVENLPEVEAAARLLPNNFTGVANVGIGQDNFVEHDFYWGDANVQEVLTFKILERSEPAPLARPGTVMLSESKARKYFGAGGALGEKIRVDNAYDLEVTGVYADLPENTQHRFGLVGAFQTIGFGKPENLSWGNASFLTFVLLREGADAAGLPAKVERLVAEKRPAEVMTATFELMPLREVYLHAGEMADRGKERYGDARQVNILAGLAALLLLIACINYMNIATAQSLQQAKEVGLRKTLGAGSRQLMFKYYTETALLAALGLAGSLAVLAVFLPYFNGLAGKNLDFGFLSQGWFWLGLFAIWAGVTVAAGSYPALFLSSFSPLQAMRQQYAATALGSANIRKGLVVFQFFISIGLIISTLVFYGQLGYIRSQNLGFQPEQVVAVSVASAERREQLERFQDELRQLPAVAAAALSQTYPGRSGSGRSLSRSEVEEGAELTTCRARPEVFEALGIPLLAGQPMTAPAVDDTITQVVLNRSAAQFLGWSPEQALGQRISANLGHAVVVGVAADFHFGSLHEKIGNYAFHNARTEMLEFQLIRLRPGDVSAAMASLKAAFERAFPNSAFDYVFLDDHLDALYRREETTARVALLFAALAIFVACLGLFALAAFTVERRQKEIGIRKVLGASAAAVTGLLSLEFVKLVAIAFLAASPLAYWFLKGWLAGFAYHIELRWWMFAAAGLAAAGVAFLAVGFHSCKAALANPVESLRRE
jgi:putative ABC transport system permease protein